MVCIGGRRDRWMPCGSGFACPHRIRKRGNRKNKTHGLAPVAARVWEASLRMKEETGRFPNEGELKTLVRIYLETFQGNLKA